MNKTNLVLVLTMLSAASVHAVQPAESTRLDEVAERGAHVMPFSLDKTVHFFKNTETGGIQQVTAKNPSDSEQIALIRKHLAKIASQFAKGDFSGPQRIHGENMPGIKELSVADGRVQFVYQDLPEGGQINYLTDAPELIDAIHRYFDAQLSDHARHAVSGGHTMHHP